MKRRLVVLLALLASSPLAMPGDHETRFRVMGFGIPLASCKLVGDRVSHCHFESDVKLDALMQAMYSAGRDKDLLERK